MSTNNRSLSNLEHINLHAISEIESEIDSYDMVSLMFLLYEDTQKALQNLTVCLRVSQDVGSPTCNLLQEWAAGAKKRSTWKSELLEALVILTYHQCFQEFRLYTEVRKLGFDTPSVKSLSKNVSDTGVSYIHPMKKIFYNVCENLDSENYKCFKKVVKIKIPDHETCEVFFLELICRGFFSPVNIDIDDVVKLINILEKIPVFKTRETQTVYDNLIKIRDSVQVPLKVLSNEKQQEDNISEKKYINDFNDSFELFNQLNEEELKNYSAAVFKTTVSK